MNLICLMISTQEGLECKITCLKLYIILRRSMHTWSLIQKKMHTWSDMLIQATDNWMVTITKDEKRAMRESVVLYVHIRTTDVSLLPLNCKTN